MRSVRRRVAIASIAVAVVLLGAAVTLWWVRPWHHAYRGDGRFTDDGWRSGTERYTLRLGTFDPSRDVHVPLRFEVGELPQKLWVGLRFHLAEDLGAGGDSEMAALKQMRVRLEVREAQTRRTILAFDGPLDPRAGEPVHFGNGRRESESSTVENAIFGGVPGGTRLVVQFEILDPPGRPFSRNGVELMLAGGGWK